MLILKFKLLHYYFRILRVKNHLCTNFCEVSSPRQKVVCLEIGMHFLLISQETRLSTEMWWHWIIESANLVSERENTWKLVHWGFETRWIHWWYLQNFLASSWYSNWDSWYSKWKFWVWVSGIPIWVSGTCWNFMIVVFMRFICNIRGVCQFSDSKNSWNTR